MSNSTVIARSAATKQAHVIAKPEALKQSLPMDCFGLRPRNDSFARNDNFARNDSFSLTDE